MVPGIQYDSCILVGHDFGGVRSLALPRQQSTTSPRSPEKVRDIGREERQDLPGLALKV